MLARLVMDGFLSGIHRSPHFGNSIEFAQYRPYVQGDDLRYVDWGLFARTDRLHVKQFHDETNLRGLIVIDSSASMTYASKGHVSKFDYARMVAACLALLLFRQKDAVGLLPYNAETLEYTPPRSTPNHLWRLWASLDRLHPEGESNTGNTIEKVGEYLPRRCLVILLSDLLHPLDEMASAFRSLRARRQDLVLLRIEDPAEVEFHFDRSVTLIDSESRQEQFVVPELAREAYLKNRATHFDALNTICSGQEVESAAFRTDEPLDRALMFFLNKRNRFVQGVSGRRNAAGGRR